MFYDVGRCFTKFDFCQTFHLIRLDVVGFTHAHLVEPNPNLPESFTLLDSFGHSVKYHPTLFHKTMLDDVSRCFVRLDWPLLVTVRSQSDTRTGF